MKWYIINEARRAELVIKHLMTVPKGNSEFCFPENSNVPRGEAEGNIEGRGETENSLFPEGPVILKVICYSSQLKIEQYTDVSLRLYCKILQIPVLCI